MLQHTPEQEEMRAFPGPLGKYVPTEALSVPRPLAVPGTAWQVLQLLFTKRVFFLQR